MNAVFLVFFMIFLTFSPAGRAGGYVPEALWESEPVSGAVLSVTLGDLDADGRANLLVLDEQKLVVYAGLDFAHLQATLPAKKHRRFHRVWACDVDGDGVSEILINGFQNDSVFSTLYRFQSGDFKLWQDFEGQIVVPWGGAIPLIVQDQKGRWAWSRDLQALQWNQDHFEQGQKLKLKGGGVGWQRVSLFDLAGLEGNLVISHGDGTLEIVQEGKSLWRSGLKYGGAVDGIVFESRDPMGMLREERFGIAPRLLVRELFEKIMPSPKAIPDLPPKKSRSKSNPEIQKIEPVFVPRGHEVLVPRNDGFLEGVIGKFPRMKSAEIVQLEWSGKILHEKAISRRFDGAISDMAVLDFDGDGLKNEVLFSLWIREGGMLESMAPKKSVLAVIRLK